MSENEKFWLEWFQTPQGLGREVFEGFGYDASHKIKGYRVFLTDYPRFTEYINKMTKGVYPCWCSVLAFSGRDTPSIIDKVYFDFDSKTNIDLAWKEAQKFTIKLSLFYHVESLLCFSGNKGFNLYIWLQKPLSFTQESKFSIKEVYTKIQEVLLKGIEAQTLDRNPYGDVKRVSRVPYSIHQESGLKCQPINRDREPQELNNLKDYVKNGISEQFVNFCLRKLEEEKKAQEEQKKHRENLPNNTEVSSQIIRPCLQAALSKNLVDSSGTKMRLGIAREYLAAKYKVEDIVQLFKNQENFNEFKTKERIEALKLEAESKDEKTIEKARPFKCKTIITLGFCLKEGCGLWRWKTERGIEP